MDTHRVVKGALLALLIPVAIAGVLAGDWTVAGKVTNVQIVNYDSVISRGELGLQDINAQLYLLVNTDYELVQPVKIDIYLISGEDDDVVYYHSTYDVSVTPGEGKFVDFKVPTIGVGQDEDSLVLKVVAHALLKNETSGEMFESTASDEKEIQIEDVPINDAVLVDIYPSLSVLEDAEARKYEFTLEITNNDVENKTLTIKARLYDIYGGVVRDISKSVEVGAGETEDETLKLDLIGVPSGEYKLVLGVYDGNKVVLYKTQEVYVNPTQGTALKFYGFELFPPQVKPGDLVLAKLYVKNILDRDLKVRPIVVSTDLGIYRELPEIEIPAGEVKEVKAVIPFNPQGPGTYKVTLKFVYDTFRSQEYTFTLYVPGEQKVLDLELEGPRTVEVGKDYNYTLRITSLEEDLFPVKIEAEAEGAVVEVPSKVIYLGGYGMSKEVNLTIRPIDYSANVTLKVIDVRSNEVLGTLNITLSAAGKISSENISTTTTGLTIDKNTILTVATIVLLIVVIVLLLTRKGNEEERPAE